VRGFGEISKKPFKKPVKSLEINEKWIRGWTDGAKN